MFNTIGRAWADTPLTAQGEEGIRELGVGLRESGLDFVRGAIQVVLFKPWELF